MILSMQNPHVASLSLRSLEFLAILLETASVTRTGEAFGLSQPAASRAVGQLRRALDDPLIVRTSKGYQLTPRGETLKGSLAEARRAIDGLFANQRFDPLTSRRIFRMATTDYGALTVVAPAVRLLATASPFAGLEVAPWAEDTLVRLEAGEVDAALYADAPLPPDFHASILFQESYVAVCDAGADAAIRALASGDLASLSRVVLLYPDGRRLLPDDVLGDLGAPKDRVALRLPYFAAVPAAIMGTDRVAALPKRVAEALGAGLIQISLPDVPLFEYRLVWHRRSHRDPAHRWLRGLVRRALA